MWIKCFVHNSLVVPSSRWDVRALFGPFPPVTVCLFIGGDSDV